MITAASAAAMLAICATLQACASDPEWPSIGKITGIGNTLTPEERQKALQDLQKGDQSHSSDAGASAKQSP